MTEEGVTSIIALMVRVYKQSEDFKNDNAKARANAYIIRFTDYRNKVA